MSDKASIGLHALDSITWYTRDLSRKHTLLADILGFRVVAADALPQHGELRDDERHTTATYQSGSCKFVCVAPQTSNGRASRYLARHPEGIGQLTFAVDDLARTHAELSRRGATFVSTASEAGGVLELVTPIDDLTFRFVERQRGLESVSPGPEAVAVTHFDHVTINTGTTLHVALWLEHVLGLSKYWQTEFHTAELNEDQESGTGLKSVVFWDPASEIKFALNEPKRPGFFASQIELFRQDHRGSGIQHVAIHVRDIVWAVSTLRRRGMRFAATPPAYYQQLQERLDSAGVGAIDVPIHVLRELEILADGSGPGRYLLQIFMEDDAAFLGGRDRSPFFIEFIERRGCSEFGAGNFRALFESIERAQARR